MKILLVHPGPDFSVSDVFNGWKKALEDQGHQVMVYATNERLLFFADAKMYNRQTEAYEAAMGDGQAVMAAYEGLGHHLYTFWPDAVVFVSAFYVRPEMLEVIRAHGHKVVILHTESPYQDDEQLLRAQHADINILNDPTNLDEYRMFGPAEYIPHAYDPDVHHPGSGPRDIDFTFVGSMFPSRVEFFERMFSYVGTNWLNSHSIALGGQAWSNKRLDNSFLLDYLGHERHHAMDNTDVADVYRESKLGINVYRTEGEITQAGKGWSMGPREVELAACGLPFLRDSRPESDELFPFLPAFSGPEDAADILKWYHEDEKRMQSLGELARNVVADRTFENNAKRLMTLLEQDR